MMDREKIMTHIKEHVDYPATKTALLEACNNMMEISEEDKKWFSENLPVGEYKTPEDAMKALGM